MSANTTDTGAIGPRIRQLRTSKGISIRQVARDAHVSASLISQLETEKLSPSLATLRGVAAALSVPVAAFFAGGYEDGEDSVATSEQPPLGRVVRRKHRKHLYLPRAQLKYELLTPDMTGPIEFVSCELEPDHPETDWNSHQGQEIILVITGKLDVYIEDSVSHLSHGDSITFNSGRRHRVINPGPGRNVHVAAISPPSF